MKWLRAGEVAALADQERSRILLQYVLGRKALDFYPLAEAEAGRELERFAAELRRIPNMEGYFDRRHILNLQSHLGEAEHGFATLEQGGILEVISIPAMPDHVMGFLIFHVFDPRDDADRGKLIGYAVYGLEKGHAPFGQAETVRLAFDIFPPYREGRYTKVPFTNHEIYQVSMRVLFRHRPKSFVVDARTQIRQSWTGRPRKRVIYYLKRGFYPPDHKPLADLCLLRLARGRSITERAIDTFLNRCRAPFWVFPVAEHMPARKAAGGPKSTPRSPRSSRRPRREDTL